MNESSKRGVREVGCAYNGLTEGRQQAEQAEQGRGAKAEQRQAVSAVFCAALSCLVSAQSWDRPLTLSSCVAACLWLVSSSLLSSRLLLQTN